MKNLGVTYDNFLPQNLAKSREPREVVVTPTCLASEKSPFTSGWKYCQGSTKTCLWKVIQLLWYLENIFSLIWRGNFVRSKASTPRHNIVKVKQKFVCKKWYNSSHWCTGLASEKFPFYIRLKIFSCVKWLSIFTDKFFYATLASTKLPRCTCLASEKLARGYALPCI